MKIASFDIDMQNTFSENCPDELPVPGAIDIVDELNAQANLAHYRIASKDAHNDKALWVATKEHPELSKITGYPNLDLRWNKHAIVGTYGFNLIDGLPTITRYDFVVWKGIELDMHPYGACYHDLNDQLSTGVIEFLKFKQVNIVLTGGVAMEYCVKHTVLQLLRANFKVIVNLNACRGINMDTSAKAISEMHHHGALVANSLVDVKNLLSNV